MHAVSSRRRWLTWRSWWLGKEHTELNTEEANPHVKERNRRRRPSANAGEARLWWLLWWLYVMAIDFEKEGTIVAVPVMEKGAEQTLTRYKKK